MFRRLPSRILPAILASVLLVPTAAAAANDRRPGFAPLRQDEDWSFLADHDGEAGRFDALKYVPLTDDGWAWASFGGQLRERVEAWSDFNFGLAPGSADENDVYLLSRLLAHADLHLGDRLRVFVQGKSSLSTDRDLPGSRRTLDVDELDLQNGFVELRLEAGDTPVRLRAGREELLFGRQRLVSPLDWSNTRRTFDGFTANASLAGWDTTAFLTRAVKIKKHEFNTGDEDVGFYGIYATADDVGAAGGVDLYWLGLDRDDVAFNGTAGNEDRHTLGARVWGSIADSSIDYDVELAYQFGQLSSADISAFMVATQLGTRLDVGNVDPRVEIGLDYASGDDDPSDGDVETFNQLFPLGHAYLGFVDVIGRQNIIDLRGKTAFDFVAGTEAAIDLHYFWRADNDDAVYNAGGGVLRAGGAGSSTDVGAELDLTIKRALGKHTLIVGGYSHFFAGEFIDEAGPDEDIDFVYLTFQYTI